MIEPDGGALAVLGGIFGFIVGLPYQYFLGIEIPPSGRLSAVPTIGTLALVVGVIWGFIIGRRDLWLFLIPFGISELLVLVAAFQSRSPVHIEPIMWSLAAAQSAVVGYLIYILRGARLPAVALAIFSISYALAASFLTVVTMTGRYP